ncbi:MAG TPA: hypothetical protein P5026_04385 [Kiritimatiellia bacterium]|nr:hypothetical protein [Kiritimatiellia bacterium]HRU71347.1 hypothetical protein [Kiritimatiellia bacterium]
MIRRLCALMVLLVTAGIVRGGEEPSVDLYTGWWVSPFRYDGAYPFGPFPWGYPGPVVGLDVPLSLRGGRYRDPYLADWGYPFGWEWGYGQRVRLRLREPRYAPLLSDEWAWPLPGSAPTELRDPERERAWEREFLNILDGQTLTSWYPDATNATPNAELRTSNAER